jgi:hypothetical protein
MHPPTQQHTLFIATITEQRKENLRNLSFAGVDVLITIFCDFSQLAFFLNTNVMINVFQNLALF